MSVLVDTNIALYLLGGDATVADLLDGRAVHVSFVTELELLSYPELDAEEREAVADFLRECVIVDLSAAIKAETIALRRSSRLKLPDALIAATALVGKMPLMSADRAFGRVDRLPLLLYEPE